MLRWSDTVLNPWEVRGIEYDQILCEETTVVLCLLTERCCDNRTYKFWTFSLRWEKNRIPGQLAWCDALSSSERSWRSWGDLHGKNLHNQEQAYCKEAHLHEFQQGDWALLLLPVSESKLFAWWQCHFEVLRHVGEDDYKIWQPAKEKQTIGLWVSNPGPQVVS